MVEHQFIKCINDKPHVEWLHLWYRSGWHGHIRANDVLITMELLGDVGHVESRPVRLEMVLVLVQDKCTVYAKRTVGSDII